MFLSTYKLVIGHTVKPQTIFAKSRAELYFEMGCFSRLFLQTQDGGFFSRLILQIQENFFSRWTSFRDYFFKLKMGGSFPHYLFKLKWGPLQDGLLFKMGLFSRLFLQIP